MFHWFRSQKRLGDLEARIEKLERERKETALEWDSMYEKFRLLYVRLSKRVKRLDEGSDQSEDTQPGEGVEVISPGGNEGSSPFALSPRQLLIQQQILQRRRKAG